MTTFGIGDALFTKTQQRVLALLYGQTDKSFYLNKIVRAVDMGRGAVSRELTKLTKSGLLTVQRQGNQNHYQANKSNPIFIELKQIVQKTFGIADLIRNALQPILPAAEQAFIYGSVAKGEDHANSDVDVLLVGEDLSYGTIMQTLEAVEQKLQRTINPTIYTPAEFAKRVEDSQNFIIRVLEQPKIELLLKEQGMLNDRTGEFNKDRPIKS